MTIEHFFPHFPAKDKPSPVLLFYSSKFETHLIANEYERNKKTLQIFHMYIENYFRSNVTLLDSAISKKTKNKKLTIQQQITVTINISHSEAEDGRNKL